MCSRWDLRAEIAAGSCPVSYSRSAKAVFRDLVALGAMFALHRKKNQHMFPQSKYSPLPPIGPY